MNENENAAYIHSQSSCAFIEALGMMSDNMALVAIGRQPVFRGEAFEHLINKYGIHHNAVLTHLGVGG